MSKPLVNRFGAKLAKGQTVSVPHPRGGIDIETIARFETKGAFVRAYGRRVVFLSGSSASVDDCTPVTLAPLGARPLVTEGSGLNAIPGDDS